VAVQPQAPRDGGGHKPEDRGPNPKPPLIPSFPTDPPARLSFTVRGPENLKDLVAFLAQGAREYEIFLAGDLNLTAEAEEPEGTRSVGLVFKDKNVRIRPAPGTVRPTIRLSPPTKEKNTDLLAALTVKGGSLDVQGVRFVIDAGQGPQAMVALRCQGGSIEGTGCEFIQAQASESSRLTDVLVEPDPEGRSAKTPSVSMWRCLFLGVGYDGSETKPLARSGQTALSVAGLARVTLTDCAFGPHTAAIAVQPPASSGAEGQAGSPDFQVTLSRCSALLDDDSAVFQVAALKGCKLEVDRCLFSRPLPPPDSETVPAMGDRGAVLVRQTDPNGGDLKYEGSDTRYHNLAAFWVKQQPVMNGNGFERWTAPVTSWDVFLGKVTGADKDKNSRVLADSPWESTKDLLALLDGRQENVRQAFRVNLQSPELRQKADGAAPPVGLGGSPWNDPPLYSRKDIPNLRKPDALAGKKKRVVNPDVKETGNGVYKDLLTAIREAGPDEVILIQHDGLVPIEPIPLEKSSLNLTIRPFEGCKPVLTLAKTSEPNAALFRLHDGKLRLEGLQFYLRPDKEGFKSQSVVTLAGDGECTFQGCVVTLEPAWRVPLAAVTLSDPSTVMKMDKASSSQVAAVTFENCFVRGEGDQVALRASRPLTLTLRNTLTALNGSLLTVEALRDDAPTPPEGAAINVMLAQTTAYLTRYLLYLKAGTDLKGLLPVRFETTTCLFLAGDNTSALVHLDGPDTKRERWKGLLGWRAEHNAYVNFSQMLEQQPGGGQMAMEAPYNTDQWQQFTNETDGTFKGVRLVDPVADARLSEVLPGRFKAKSDSDQPAGFGPKLEDVPLPWPATGGRP
jgi:hypothetical protein